MIGVAIEMAVFGIEGGSQNTADIVAIAKGAPIAILAIVVFGPILEEFVFRRVIFGSLVQTTNFWWQESLVPFSLRLSTSTSHISCFIPFVV